MRLGFPLFASLACFLTQAFGQANDNFASRLALSGAPATAVSNNLQATREGSEPNHAASAAGRSLWWTWTAPTTGLANFSTFNGSSGNAPARVLAVYSGDTLPGLTEIASSNNLPYFVSTASIAQAAALAATGASVNVPVTAGAVYQIAVDAASVPTSSDDGTVVLAIDGVPTVVSAAAVNATTGTSFQYNILASNGATTYGAATLPTGLSVNPSSGLISGTPTVAGTYPVGLAAMGPGGTGTATLTVQVADPVPTNPTVPVIIAAAGARAVVGKAFTYAVSATGAPTAYTASNLPAGLSVNTTTGAITGTPTAAGMFAVPLTALNAAGTTSAVLTLSVDATPPAPVITSALAGTATVGSSYSYYIYTAGDNTLSAPSSYAASGLPPGLSLGTSYYFSGTPTQAGIYPVTLSATNAGGTSTATVTITVNATAVSTAAAAPPLLSSNAAANAAVGTAFSYTLSATNTPTAYAASSLPAGLSVNTTTGTISGTPTAAGSFPVPVAASNGYGTGTGTLTITVVASAAAQAALNGVVQPLITSAPFAGGYTGQTLSYTLAATYAGSGYLMPSGSWTFAASGLPPGLSLSSSTSSYGSVTIAGTPTTAGTYAATVSAMVPAGTSPPRSAATTTAVVTFVIKAGPAAVPTFGISAGFSDTATLVSYSNFSIGATNNPTSYSASGLPPGLSLSPTTGALNGTPTAGGTYVATLSAVNAAGTGSAQVTFVEAPPPAPYIVSAGAANGTVGSGFTYTISLNTNPAASYGASNLPPGLGCNPANGNITGTPTAAGTFLTTVTATGASGDTGSAVVTITIAANAYSIPSVASACVAQGTVGSSFAFGLYSLQNGFSYTANGLPPGLSLAASNGQISGTPTKAGTFTVPVSVTNPAGTGNATLTIIIAPAQPPVLSGSGVVNAVVGTALSYTTSATNSPTGYAASNLPPGVTLNSATGVISGTPTAAGNYAIPLSATNAAGTIRATLTIIVTTATPTGATLTSSNPLVLPAQVGVAGYSYIDSTGVPSYAASGLPPGITVNTTSGYIGGTPTTAGTYPVTISETDTSGTNRAVVTYVVTNPPPDFTLLAAAVSGVVNASFRTTLTATNSPTSYAASPLPPGLTLDPATGIVSGTPTALGTYSVNVSATNAAGTGNAVWTVSIGNTAAVVPVFSYSGAGAIGMVGQSLVWSTIASTSNLALTYTFSGGPPGTVGHVDDEGYAYFSGAPTAAGTYVGTVTATTQYGGSASVQVKYVIAPAIPPAVGSAASVGGNVGSALSYRLTSYSTITSYAASGLPPGLVFNAATGTITGTPTAAGAYTTNVAVTSATGTGAGVVTFVIAGPAYGGLPIITSAATTACQDIYSPNGYYLPTQAFGYTIAALNAPTSFGATHLPAGLSLNPFTGMISGQPTVSGIFQVPISATNAAGTCTATLTIVGTVTFPTLLAPLAASGSVGTPFSIDILIPAIRSYGLSYYESYQKPYDPVTFTAVGLPPGLSMDTVTGYLTGTPSQAGIYPVALAATNRAGTSSGVMTMVIASTAPAPTGLPVFSGQAMAAGIVGSPFSYALAATNAPGYAATGLAAGLSLNAANGLITGTPQAAGTFAVPATATNNIGTTHGTLTLIITAAPTAPFVSSAAQANATLGTPFVYAVYAGNYAGMPTATGYGAGVLPTGLQFDPKTGFIGGTPTGSAGTYQIPISASTGGVTGTATLTLVVQAAAAATRPFALSNAAGALGFVDNPFAYSLGSALLPSSALPSGLSSDPHTGAIVGFPGAAGSYQIALAANSTSGNNVATATAHRPLTAGRAHGEPGTTDSGGSAVLTLTIVTPDLSLPCITVQPGGGTILQNVDVTFTAAAVGAPVPSYQWAHDGVPITGATTSTLTLRQAQPADAGIYTVTAANAAGQTISTPAALVVHQNYATWQAAHFTSAEIAAGAGAAGFDFNGDGVVNLLKYALGIDPITGAGGSLPVGLYSIADHTLQLLFTRDAARADVTYVVEASSDLSQWAPIASSTAGASTINLGGSLNIVETVSYGTSRVDVVVESSQPPVTTDRQFLRLRVIQP